jgi:hypothetical protein
MIRKRRKAAARRTAGAQSERRRDDKGMAWTRAELEVALAGIVATLNRTTARDIGRSTRFDDRGLGWDDWFKLTLVKPVKKQVHVTLSHTMVKNDLKTVGNLHDYAWSLMEPI